MSGTNHTVIESSNHLEPEDKKKRSEEVEGAGVEVRDTAIF